MIVDTGILYALIDRRDRHHQEAVAIFERRELKVVPEPVIVETDWLVAQRMGVEVEIGFLNGLDGRTFEIEAPTPADRSRAAALVAQYRELDIGYVDAVTAAISERLREVTIATLDRRHFGVIRPRHAEYFTIIP